MHFLFQEEVLEASDIEQIYSSATEKQSIVKMLYTLWAKTDERWIEVFLKSLQNCDSSRHLLKLFQTEP